MDRHMMRNVALVSVLMAMCNTAFLVTAHFTIAPRSPVPGLHAVPIIGVSSVVALLCLNYFHTQLSITAAVASTVVSYLLVTPIGALFEVKTYPPNDYISCVLAGYFLGAVCVPAAIVVYLAIRAILKVLAHFPAT